MLHSTACFSRRTFGALAALLIASALFSQSYQTHYPFDPNWSPSGPTINIQDLGAVPDDGINDSQYFQQAATIIENNGSGTLFIPAGQYIVGEQVADPNPQTPYYNMQPIFWVQNIDGIIIEGEPGSILKAADGLAFGAFDQVTGDLINPLDSLPIYGGAWQTKWKNDAEIMFQIFDSENIIIRDLELDGNILGLNIGGVWGHEGSRQCEAQGMFIAGCKNVLLKSIHTHHHGLDGGIVEGNCQNENCNPTPYILENVLSEYNSRQGFSWVGGKGFTAYNCKFNFTSKAGPTSNPAAGVDIEAGGNLISRGGKFIDCEFIGNLGSGLVCDSPTGINGYSIFENCLFAGNDDNPIWPAAPGLKFYNCQIYGGVPVGHGNADPDLANYFNGCHFEDLNYGGHGLDNREYVMLMWAPGPNITFDNCDWVANNRKAFKVTDNPGSFHFNNCTITNKYTGLEDGAWQCSAEGSILNDVEFIDEYPASFNKKYWIETYFTTVENCVYVEGETVNWQYTNGPLGWIKPGMYPDENGLDITSPDGGENWELGTTYDIAWQNTSPAADVILKLYKDCILVETISTSTQNDGLFSWTPAATLEEGDDYSVKVESTDNKKVFALSEIFFSLHMTSLAVELGNFRAEKNGKHVLLKWSTYTEIDNRGFEIQKSSDGRYWKKFGWVQGKGNSSGTTKYRFIDSIPFDGENIYRLRIYDYDGSFEYSNIASVYFDGKNNVSIYPNPVSSILHIKYENMEKPQGISIYDTTGRQHIFIEKRISEIDLSALPKGVYFLKMIFKNEIIFEKILVE